MLYFDVTLMVGQNATLEYDKTGGIVDRQSSLNSLNIQIANEKIGKFTILKDPVINHVNIYAIEFFDLPLEILNMFKSNLITSIIVRIGDSIVEGKKNFNLFKIFIKPITLYEHPIQDDKVLNDLIVKGISLTANAMVLDSTFGSELEIIDTTSVSTSVKTPTSKTVQLDTSTLAKVNLLNTNNDIGIAFNNPGNLDRTNSEWLGKIYDNNARQEKFITPEYGVRAWGINALGKINKGYNTLEKLLTLLTPPHENKTGDYISSSAAALGWTVDEVKNRRLTESDLANIMKIIIPLESDRKIATNYYNNDVINKGFAMAGINSQVTINPGSWFYGNGKAPKVNGTNVNKILNVYANMTGFSLLSTFLQKLKEKYGVETDTKSMANNLKSNFLYKNISMPAAPTLNLLKKLHVDYSPYMANVPWILDDAKPILDVNFLGKTFYTEINILAIESLDFKSLKHTFGNNTTLSNTRLSIDNFKQFYQETLDRIEAKNIVFKNLNTNQETSFQGKASNEVAVIPDVGASTNNSEGIKQIKIQSGETVKVEAMYDAIEFQKRYELFKNHVKTNPQIVRCRIQSDNPIFIDFGYAYTFSEQQLNKVTPYKIKIEFRNLNNEFQVTHEVDFYKGISVVQA